MISPDFGGGDQLQKGMSQWPVLIENPVLSTSHVLQELVFRDVAGAILGLQFQEGLSMTEDPRHRRPGKMSRNAS